MNPQQTQLAIDALSHLFSSKLTLSHSLPKPRPFFSRQRSIIASSLPEHLSLRLNIAPGYFVGVRVAVSSDARALEDAATVFIVEGEGGFRSVFVRVDEIVLGWCAGGVGDAMDVCEEEMYWVDGMDID